MWLIGMPLKPISLRQANTRYLSMKSRSNFISTGFFLALLRGHLKIASCDGLSRISVVDSTLNCKRAAKVSYVLTRAPALTGSTRLIKSNKHPTQEERYTTERMRKEGY